jgi:hypothetical protein
MRAAVTTTCCLALLACGTVSGRGSEPYLRDRSGRGAAAGREASEFETKPGIAALAKAEGWTLKYPHQSRGGGIEIAYDREAAELAYEEHFPDGLGPGTGTGPGSYGSLDDVDFERQAVIVWSHGESSCPGWLADIDTMGGRVRVELGDTGRDCDEAFHPYRMLIAVDHERLPAPEALPMSTVEGVDVLFHVLEFESSDPRHRRADVDPSITTLAKMVGWRGDRWPGAGEIVEVAYDEEIAQRAWTENVPADLEPTSVLGQPGLHGELDEVSLEGRALVVVSFTESGSCPSWITRIEKLPDGRLQVQQVSFSDGRRVCTSDGNPYRVVLAVDRDRLPDPAELPTEVEYPYGAIPVEAYPADGSTQ